MSDLINSGAGKTLQRSARPSCDNCRFMRAATAPDKSIMKFCCFMNPSVGLVNVGQGAIAPMTYQAQIPPSNYCGKHEEERLLLQ